MNYTKKEYIIRLIWNVTGQLLFHVLPRFSYSTRRYILLLFGASIGKRTRVSKGVKVFYPPKLFIGEDCGIGSNVSLYNLDIIKIDSSCTISQDCYLAGGSHDYRDNMKLIKAPIFIGRNSWLAAGVFVHPNVKIGQFSVICARSVVQKSISGYGLYCGFPCIKIRDDRHLYSGKE